MYRLHDPHDALAPYIENYWEVTSTPDAPVDLRVDVYVDARSDLIFNFGAPYARTEIGGEHRLVSRSTFEAQRLVPIRIEQRGDVRTRGVRFRLGGPGAFAVVPLRGVTGGSVEPSGVFGADAPKLASELDAAPDLEACAAILDDFFLARETTADGFRTFRRALQRLEATDGRASVSDVAEHTGVSPRHVARLFARYLGIPPKTLGRVLRFQRTMRMLMSDPGCSLSEVAQSAGYFDQAHFIRDFRRMTGGVPRGYRGYYPPEGPHDFAPNVVVFVQDPEGGPV